MFFILIYSKLWLYSNKVCAVFILGTIAEKSFRNLRIKYGREKRQLKVTNRSGAGAGEVKRPYIQNYGQQVYQKHFQLPCVPLTINS